LAKKLFEPILHLLVLKMLILNVHLQLSKILQCCLSQLIVKPSQCHSENTKKSLAGGRVGRDRENVVHKLD
jgi:hypothetical protein